MTESEKRLREYIHTTAPSRTAEKDWLAVLDSALEDVRAAWKEDQDAWTSERDRLNSRLEASRVRVSSALQTVPDTDLGQMFVAASGVFGLGTSWATMTDGMRACYSKAGREMRRMLVEHLDRTGFTP